MTQNTQAEMSPDQRSIWLKEYELCQQDNDSQSSRYWTIVGIFIPINPILLSALMIGLGNSAKPVLTYYAVMFLGLLMIAINIKIWRWVKRVDHLMNRNTKRMITIEKNLAMRKCLDAQEDDKKNKGQFRGDCLPFVGDIAYIIKRKSGYQPSSSGHFDGIMISLLGAWVIVIATACIWY